MSSNAKAGCEAKAGKVVWGVGLEWFGLLALLELVDSAWSLLAEYHDLFSLEPSKLGSTHSTEHVIKVTDDALFKEWFRQIPLPLVEEVCTHQGEMLDSGAIHPSQSAWCNAVVLIQKKDGGLCFCLDFCCHNTYMMKDSYPLPRIQEALESLVGAGYFSCLDLKSGFWPIMMDESSEQNTEFMVGNLGFFKCDCMPFGLCNAPAMFQWLMQNCLRELNLIYCLIYLDDIVIFLQTTKEHLHHLCVILDWFREPNLKLKPSKCNFFQGRNCLPSTLSLKGWSATQWLELRSNHRLCTTSNLHRSACLSWSCWPQQEVH